MLIDRKPGDLWIWFWFYSGLMVLNAVIEEQVTIENEIKPDQNGKDEMIFGLGKK